MDANSNTPADVAGSPETAVEGQQKQRQKVGTTMDKGDKGNGIWDWAFAPEEQGRKMNPDAKEFVPAKTSKQVTFSKEEEDEAMPQQSKQQVGRRRTTGKSKPGKQAQHVYPDYEDEKDKREKANIGDS